MEAIQEYMRSSLNLEGFKSDDQRAVVEEILAQLNAGWRDFVLSMATQAGKSLIYQVLGGVKNSGVTVIFSPSLALINNQLECLTNDATSINVDVSYAERNAIMNNLQFDASRIRFLFLTPEMACKEDIAEFLNELIKNGKINYFIVEEAHRIVDTTYFRPSFNELKNYRSLDKNIPWIALTTADNATCEEIALKLKMNNPHIIIKSSVRKNIFYDVASFDNFQFIANFIDSLRNESETEIPSGIIFCQTVNRVTSIALDLRQMGIVAREYHGNLQERFDYFREWVQGTCKVLVATDESFGFGINLNVPAVRFVIHYGEPKNIRHYYQESGRAGNDGRKSYSRVYLDVANQNFTTYLNANCKRQALANYFGEEIDECQEWCDACVRRNNNA